ncbi:MAG: cation transporter [Acholeplasmatales bacterium]|nr:cation transporter [Acholeplasmatales bacterium]MBR6288666.1 cation transporter [Acholeplasmatales bacterium]
MINLLRKKFIKNYENIKDKDVRLLHGVLASIIGIVSNFLVFISKLIIGILSFSVSIISDAINNLSDMASSLVSLFGFKMAKKKPDADHPFGHERIEYISGLIVSMIIIIVGLVLVGTSIYKITTYEPVSISNNFFMINMIVLGVSILIKIYQAYAYYKIAKIISSISLKANFRDSLNDCIVTSTILIAFVIEYLLGKNNIIIPFSLDGVLGIIVSLFIISTGVSLLKEESDPLIGTKLNKTYIDEVLAVVKRYPDIINYHDIMCHTYGENKCYMTIHLEVDKNKTLEEVHDIIDEIEYIVKKEYNIELTSHIDPIDLNDSELSEIKDKITNYLNDNYKDITIHDVRIVRRGNKSLVLFDMCTPFDFKKDLNYEINNLFENKYEFMINIDHPYY